MSEFSIIMLKEFGCRWFSLHAVYLIKTDGNFYMKTFKKNEVETVVKSANESLYLIIFTNVTVLFMLFALSYNCCADISTQNYLKDVVMVNKLTLCMSILRSNNYNCSDSY